MKLTLESEESIVLRWSGSAALDIEPAEPGLAFSPFHMLAASLATCTCSVLLNWAHQAGLGTEDLEVRVTWSFVEEPLRVGFLDMQLRWPSLPAARHAAAVRAAAHCTVHATLSHPPAVRTTVV